MFAWQVHNALFVIRTFCKFLTENLSEDVMFQQFNLLQSDTDGTFFYSKIPNTLTFLTL